MSGLSPMTNRADLKARMALSRASTAGQIPMLVGQPSDMPGWSLYKVGRVAVMMPTLLPDAPKSIRRRYLARILANATGRCPVCGEVDNDPEMSATIPRGTLAHESWCNVSDDGSMDRWLDPASRAAREAMS